MSEKSTLKSSTLALWMLGGAASGGAFALWPSYLSARTEILESYIDLTKEPTEETPRLLLDAVLAALEDAPNLVYLAAVLGALFAIPVAFAMHHYKETPRTCRHKCSVHGHQH